MTKHTAAEDKALYTSLYINTITASESLRVGVGPCPFKSSAMQDASLQRLANSCSVFSTWSSLPRKQEERFDTGHKHLWQNMMSSPLSASRSGLPKGDRAVKGEVSVFTGSLMEATIKVYLVKTTWRLQLWSFVFRSFLLSFSFHVVFWFFAFKKAH